MLGLKTVGEFTIATSMILLVAFAIGVMSLAEVRTMQKLDGSPIGRIVE